MHTTVWRHLYPRRPVCELRGFWQILYIYFSNIETMFSINSVREQIFRTFNLSWRKLSRHRTKLLIGRVHDILSCQARRAVRRSNPQDIATMMTLLIVRTVLSWPPALYPHPLFPCGVRPSPHLRLASRNSLCASGRLGTRRT